MTLRLSSVAYRCAACLLACSVLSPLALADEWPQWLGPDRDATYSESGVVTEIPADGLPIKWRVPAATGYAGPAVADGKVFLFEYEITDGELTFSAGRPDELDGTERLRCLDAETGEELWKHEYKRPYRVSYGGGPRCTPTVDGDRVYTLGAEGDLHCLNTADGSVVWKKNFRDDYSAATPIWGHAAHPLVDGDTLYCMVGGADALVVAFDKQTGEEKWSALNDSEPGYCPPNIILAGKQPQLLIWSPQNLYALKPNSGEVIWSVPAKPSYGMAIARPQKQGDKLYVSAIGGVSVLMQLKPDGSDVEVLWSGGASDSLQAANVTPIFTPEAIYGPDCQSSELVALSPEDGSRLWATKRPTMGDERGRHGTAFVVPHTPSGDYFLFNEQGDLITARLTPDAYTETGRMHVLAPTSSSFGRDVVWSCPAFAYQAVFARNDKEIVCVDLSAE
ncbi:outer membrane biogenesis protein BamB [Posidoniimonas polymericola]|uniref:Outer membrane biogenesis protein BamB n=1 Tax=Posidoniimonas polymericola TaxID=2528002 RepID=A0A5C5ZE49_9BACT|nr:PQQ-binding-like beta-propeller repeat protein [Posidoniimonas polymericola]TWT85347.1 outer membrane biogenesis protein BamB [Posidoniimonas polymericola]